jgi:hypothetical protein
MMEQQMMTNHCFFATMIITKSPPAAATVMASGAEAEPSERCAASHTLFFELQDGAGDVSRRCGAVFCGD